MLSFAAGIAILSCTMLSPWCGVVCCAGNVELAAECTTGSGVPAQLLNLSEVRPALPLPLPLQAPDGSLQTVSGSRRMELPLDTSLTGLERLRQGEGVHTQQWLSWAA